MATVDRCDEIIDLIDRVLREALDENQLCGAEPCGTGSAGARSDRP
jgi:hypothetical protein